ncbi:hypothetical protein OIU78_023051 [Salix suchowensis]|nr:hypothetical protein OIU78_023051 [Salix suchowensis]
MPQKILLCGWRRDIDDMIVVSSFVKPLIFSFLRLDAAGMERKSTQRLYCSKVCRKDIILCKVAVDISDIFSRLENIQLVNREGNAVIRRRLESLPLHSFDSSKRLPLVSQVRRGSFSQGSWIGEMQHVEKCLQSAENVALFIENLNFEFLISRNKTLVVI